MKVAKAGVAAAVLLAIVAIALMGDATAGTTPSADSNATIFVANGYDVTAYPAVSSGDVAPIAVTPDMAAPNGIARDGSGRIYIANPATSTITVYASNAGGNVPPVAVIGGANTMLSNPNGIALDASGKIYVLNGGFSFNITVYPPLATNTGILNEAPVADIAGSNTFLDFPIGIAVDARGDICVANAVGGPIGPGDTYAPGVITVYSAGSNGNVAPTATIFGAATGLFNPLGIALDSEGNIYVSNGEGQFSFGTVTVTLEASITVYSAGSTGNVAPIRTITGNDTGLYYPQGIALDSSGNLYTEGYVNGGGDGVNAYAAGSNGDVSPLTSIIGADTGLAGPNGIVVDAGGRLYVSNSGGGPTGGGSVTIYAAGSTGDAVPATTITSSFAGLPSASRVAVDSAGNIYVANESGGGSVDIYSAGSYATDTPGATIAGDNTGLNYPLGIAVDFAGNIFVLNRDNAVTVYPAGTAGDVTPNATINIDTSGKNVPTGMGLSPHGDLYVTNLAVVKCHRRSCHKISSPSVAVYPAGSDGNAKASAVISGPKTQLGSPSAVAVDESGQIYVTDEGPAKCVKGCCSTNGPGSVNVYAPGSKGDVMPIATIKGKSTGISLPYGITVDSNGNIYVLNNGTGIFDGCFGEIDTAAAPIEIFAAGSHGDIAPTAAISGPFTGLNSPQGIAIGPAGP